MLLRQYLDDNNITYEIKNGAIEVGGDLDLRGTGISELPDNLQVGGGLYLRGTGISELPDNLQVGGGLYLDPTKQFKSQTAYHSNCGRQNRTIYAVFLNEKFMISAGCFLGPFDEFCRRVENEYEKISGDKYIAQAQECVDELMEKLL